jgi:hypothetical protein
VTRTAAIEVLSGGPRRVAFALSWVSPEALRVLTWQGLETDPAEMLAAVADTMHLDLAFIPAGEPWSADAVRLLRHADVASAWTVSGVLGRVAEHSSLADVVKRSASEPGTLAFALSEVLHEALTDVRAGEAAEADALVVADDLASASGWLVSPDFALEALIPCYRQLARETGLPAIFHSDGDVRALYPALAAAGFSAVHVAVSGYVAIGQAILAAQAAGLVPVGGIEATALLRDGATRAGQRAAALGASGPLLVCDDGGIASPEELAAYTTALAAARVATESADAGR